jgi:hypothetical protein
VARGVVAERQEISSGFKFMIDPIVFTDRLELLVFTQCETLKLKGRASRSTGMSY